MQIYSKTFKRKINAKKFIQRLILEGRQNIQLWEFPSSGKANVFIVIWEQ